MRPFLSRAAYRAAAIALVASATLGAQDQQQTRGLKLPTTDGRIGELYTESHALVIGMSRYTSGWRVLPGVESDMEPVRAVLQAHGFVVEVARDLTRDAFDRTMRRF